MLRQKIYLYYFYMPLTFDNFVLRKAPHHEVILIQRCSGQKNKHVKMNKYVTGLLFFLGQGFPNILVVFHICNEKRRVKKDDDQNIGSHKMITDSVFILFKKIDTNTISAYQGASVGWQDFVSEILGNNFIDSDFLFLINVSKSIPRKNHVILLHFNDTFFRYIPITQKHVQ